MNTDIMNTFLSIWTGLKDHEDTEAISNDKSLLDSMSGLFKKVITTEDHLLTNEEKNLKNTIHGDNDRGSDHTLLEYPRTAGEEGHRRAYSGIVNYILKKALEDPRTKHHAENFVARSLYKLAGGEGGFSDNNSTIDSYIQSKGVSRLIDPKVNPIDLGAVDFVKEKILLSKNSGVLKKYAPLYVENIVRGFPPTYDSFSDIFRTPEFYDEVKKAVVNTDSFNTLAYMLDDRRNSGLPRLNQNELNSMLNKNYDDLYAVAPLSQRDKEVFADYLNTRTLDPRWAELAETIDDGLKDTAVHMSPTFAHMVYNPRSVSSDAIFDFMDRIPNYNRSILPDKTHVANGDFDALRTFSPAAIAYAFSGSKPLVINNLKTIPDDIIEKLSKVSDFNKNNKRGAYSFLNEIDNDHVLLTHPLMQHFKILGSPENTFNSSVSFHPDNEKLFEMKHLIRESGGTLDRQSLKKFGYDANQLGINDVTNDRHISTNHVDDLIKKKSTQSFGISHDEWDGVQTHSKNTKNIIMKFDLPQHKLDQIKSDPQLYAIFSKMSHNSKESAHPVNEGKTLGWVRYSVGSDGAHIDEVQTDFSDNHFKSLMNDRDNNIKSVATPENIKKLQDIMFDGYHPSQLLHSAFLQAHRDAGFDGKKMQIWNDKSKASISLSEEDKSVPVHMKEGYGKIPKKMGYTPSRYGELSMQDSEIHAGKTTWEKTLKKSRHSVKNLIRELESLLKSQQ